MLKVVDDKIYLVRGDDAILALDLVDQEGNAYQMQEGDALYLTVREFPSETSPVIFSVVGVSGSNRIVIDHDDTEGKECGAYSADIQLVYADGRRDTIWPADIEDGKRLSETKNWKNFMLCTEVTRP